MESEPLNYKIVVNNRPDRSTFVLGSPAQGRLAMRRETAEKIIAAMKVVDVALNKLHEELREIEDKDERMMIIRNYFDLVNDAHVHITMKVVKQFADLHPDKHLFEKD